MEPLELKKRVRTISEAVVNMKYHEWNKISRAIDQKFSAQSSRVELNDQAEIMRAIELECGLFSDNLNT